jgi:predicted dehydrogenase
MDLGVYPLAWVRRLVGEEFTVASGSAVFRHGVDASFVAELEYTSGVMCNLTSSMIEPAPVARLVVRGDKGTLSVRNPVAPQMGHSMTLTTSTGERVETVDGPSSYEAQLKAVVASLNGAPFPLPPDDYVRSMVAIERVREKLGEPMLIA